MSKYNHYVQDMHNYFIKSRDNFRESYEAYDSAKKNFETAQRWQPEKVEGENELRIARARVELDKAQKAFEAANPDIWGEYVSACKYLRDNLQKELTATGLVDPGAVDMNAVELLKSGIMKAADYRAMADKYADNATMRRLVGKYAEEASDTVESKEDRIALYDVVNDCTDDATATMKLFDEFYNASIVFCKVDTLDNKVPARDLDLSVSMSAKWENADFVGAVLEDF